MDFSIASILALDGLTNGAVYALLGLATVLVFAVTRVIFIPQGEFVAYGALTLAIFQTGQVPGTVWLLLIMAGLAALMDGWAGWQRHHSAIDALKGALHLSWLPVLIAVVAIWAAPRQLPLLAQAALTVAIVTAFGPLVYRLAYQSLADASSLVLLIVSVGVHLPSPGWACCSSVRKGSATLRSGTTALPWARWCAGQAIIIGLTSVALIVMLWLFFERTLYGKASRATAANRLGARLMGISTQGQGSCAGHGGAHWRAVGPADRPHHYRVL